MRYEINDLTLDDKILHYLKAGYKIVTKKDFQGEEENFDNAISNLRDKEYITCVEHNVKNHNESINNMHRAQIESMKITEKGKNYFEKKYSNAN